MIRAARRDGNEAEIVTALRAAGATVAKLSGDGIPDLLVEYCGVLHLVEVKDRRVGYVHTRPRGKHADPDPRYRELTPAQVKWWRAWGAAGGKPPAIVHDAAEALAAIGAASDEQMIAKIMTTTGATRAEAERAMVDGKRMASELIAAWQRNRDGSATPSGSGTRDDAAAPSPRPGPR